MSSSLKIWHVSGSMLNKKIGWFYSKLLGLVLQPPFFFFFFLLFFFLAEACGISNARHQIGESELQLPGYSTATATWSLSYICNLHYSSRQHRIINPLSEARDQIHILMDTSRVYNPLSHNGNSHPHFLRITVCPIYSQENHS